MAKNVCAHTIMKTDLVFLPPDMAVGDAAELLIKKKTAMAFVVDEHGVLLGTFTEHDALRPFLDNVYFESDSGQVRDFMSDAVIFALPHDDLVQVASNFISCRCKIMPVIEDKKVIGYVTRRDLLAALNKEWLNKSTLIASRKPPVIGGWAKRYKPNTGSALPGGFTNNLAARYKTKR